MCDISLRYLIYHITGIFSFSLTPMFEANTVTICFTNIYVAARRWGERRYPQVILLDFYIILTSLTNHSCAVMNHTLHIIGIIQTIVQDYSTLLTGQVACMQHAMHAHMVLPYVGKEVTSSCVQLA